MPRFADTAPSLAQPSVHPIMSRMYRIIGGDGREYGPVTAAQIEQWIAQNRANARTQVKPEGAEVWSALGELPEFASGLGARAATPPLPGTQPETNTAATEPAIATAPEPAADTARPQADPAAAARACIGRSYRLSVFDTLSHGWDIVAARPFLAVGACTIAFLLALGGSSLPQIGAAISIFLPMVLVTGASWVLLRIGRGEDTRFADLFAGFTRAFRSLVVLGLVSGIVLRLLALLAAAPLLWNLHRDGALSTHELQQVLLGGDPFGGLLVLFANKGVRPEFATVAGPLALLPLLTIPFLYLSVAWVFAPLLVIDRGLQPLEALELSRRVASKRWFRLFFLNLAFFPLAFAGLLCFVVGILVVLALNLASFVAAYETAFADAPENGSGTGRAISSRNPRD